VILFYIIYWDVTEKTKYNALYSDMRIFNCQCCNGYSLCIHLSSSESTTYNFTWILKMLWLQAYKIDSGKPQKGEFFMRSCNSIFFPFKFPLREITDWNFFLNFLHVLIMQVSHT